MDSETERVDSDNEGVEKKVLTPERKGYILRNPPNGNYSDKRATWLSMGWNNIIVGSNEIHSVAKAYVNVVNAITSFVKPTPPTNIINNKTILTQYRIKQGLKVFGNKGEAAVRKELHQFCDHRVVEPKKPQDLSYEQRRRSLAYTMFMKLKSDEVTIKGRGCADGRKQRDWLSKEDTSSPTVSTEGLMLSCMVDVMKDREVATVDIPGAFLQTDYDKVDIHIKLEGAMVTLIEDIDPEYYKDFIFTYKRGRKCMYAEAKKAIYGTLEASLLFWAKLSKSLEEMGYQRNEYDWCVMNKIIDNKLSQE